MIMASSYDLHKDRARDRQAAISKAGRDIGKIPLIADVERRESCKDSLKLFCETYNPEAFYLGWSDDQLRAISRIEEAAKMGALYAFAMPRGSGKTALCRMGTLWAVSYVLRRYPFLIGANASKGIANLKAIKMFIRFLPEYTVDFPEICFAAQVLGGIANKASGQLCDGSPTMIEWGLDQIALPTVPCPENWPDHWERGKDGMAPTSGSVIGASGLTGDGIRGSLFTSCQGEMLRPDLVLLDDPQTDESAASMAGNYKREDLVSGAVLGMAGPGKSISAVMPCTVIRPGDFVDNILDRKKHPLWRGERTQMLRSMPKNMDAWEKYFEVYRRCALLEPPNYSKANVYYKKNQKILDEGAEASWEDRKQDCELSAIQSAMHLFCRNENKFYAEYQNDPRTSAINNEFYTATQMAAKSGNTKKRIVPIGAQKITAFIDVQHKVLYYAVGAYGEYFTGRIIDYGTHPDQKRPYYNLSNITKTLGRKYKGRDVGGAVYQGLLDLFDLLISREWKGEDGVIRYIERLMVDAGDGNLKGVIYKACRDSPHSSIILPSFGRGVKAGDKPMGDWKKSPGEVVGHNWRIRTAPKEGVKYAIFDANAWKAFYQERFATPAGELGCLDLYKDTEANHRMFGEHSAAESATITEGQGRKVLEFKLPPNRPDNHLGDCGVGTAVAASTVGIETIGHTPKPKNTKRRKATGAWAK